MLLFNSKAVYYPDENRAMPPRLRYFIYFLDFDTESYWGCFNGCAISCSLGAHSKFLNVLYIQRGRLYYGTMAQWPVRACFEIYCASRGGPCDRVACYIVEQVFLSVYFGTPLAYNMRLLLNYLIYQNGRSHCIAN